MTRMSLFLDKFYLFIQIIIFKISFLSIIFISILYYKFRIEKIDRVMSDLIESPLTKFIVEFIFPIVIACIYYAVFKLCNLVIKRILICVVKVLETEPIEEVISKFANIATFLFLISLTYSMNIDVSKVFNGTNFPQETRDSFTGIFATSLFILEGLNMYKLDYICKLVNWITTDNQGNKYPPLFDLKIRDLQNLPIIKQIFPKKSRKELEKELEVLEQQMRDFTKDLEFEKAAVVRDKIRELKAYLLEI